MQSRDDKLANLEKARAAKVAKKAEQDSAVLAALQQLMARMDALEARQTAQAERQPQFRPMEAPPPPTNHIRPVPKLRGGEERSGQRGQIPMTAKGWHVNNVILAQHPQRFQIDDLVRINPDATRPGQAKTWGEILSERNSDGVGTITKVYWLSDKTGQWKYAAKVPGITGARPDGFSDDELLPVG